MFKQLINYYRYLFINMLYGIHINELSLAHVTHVFWLHSCTCVFWLQHVRSLRVLVLVLALFHISWLTFRPLICQWILIHLDLCILFWTMFMQSYCDIKPSGSFTLSVFHLWLPASTLAGYISSYLHTSNTTLSGCQSDDHKMAWQYLFFKNKCENAITRYGILQTNLNINLIMEHLYTVGEDCSLSPLSDFFSFHKLST